MASQMGKIRPIYNATRKVFADEMARVVKCLRSYQRNCGILTAYQ